jgi:hypothetical protein
MKLMFAFACWLVMNVSHIDAQGKFYTKSARITFFSSTSMEDIEAINKNAVAVLDANTGDIQFAVLMKGFEFKKALMQEHFNRNYVESDKFPRAEFKGRVVNNSEVNYQANGSYPVQAAGKLTIHGQTKDIQTPGTIVISDGKITLKAIFHVTVADYNISIPKLYRDNISNSIRVTVEGTMNAM